MSCFQFSFYYFFHETFSTNTLVEAEVDDVMDYILDLGGSRNDTATGVSWTSGGGSFLLLSVPISMSAISISFSFVIAFLHCVRACEGGGFLFAVLLLWRNKGFPSEFVGVFSSSGTDPRHLAGASATLLQRIDQLDSQAEARARLWIMVCSSLGGGRQRVRRCRVCHREREPRGAGCLRGRIESGSAEAVFTRG